MKLCHGKGNPDGDGCCYVAGAVCPLRWKIVGGRIFNHLGTDLGTVDDAIRARVGSNPQRRQRAMDQLQGTVYVCTAAVDVLVEDPTRLTNRPAFEAAWNTHPGYLAQVRPHWDQLEQKLGLAPGSYQCSTWKGIKGPECCFVEDEATNVTKATTLTPVAVDVRSRGGL